MFNWSTADPIFLKSSVDHELGKLRKRKLYSADWARFKDSVNFPETFTNFDEVTSCLVAANEASILQSSSLVHVKYHNHWYNEDISQAGNVRKRTLR